MPITMPIYCKREDIDLDSSTRLIKQAAELREGLQEARVGALQERAEIRQENYKAPRRAAGRHRLLDVGVLRHRKKKGTLISVFLRPLSSAPLEPSKATAGAAGIRR